MCRSLSYLGPAVSMAALLYEGDSSFVGQTTRARLLPMSQLAGAGVAAWHPRFRHPEHPLIYRTTRPAVVDANLAELAGQLETEALIALLRGVAEGPRTDLSEDNTHPFHHPGARTVLAHNGELADFASMKFSLLPHVRADLAARIRGCTDSEWIYSLLLSRLDDPLGTPSAEDLVAATRQVVGILTEVRRHHGIGTSSPFNIVVGHGEALVATRFTFDAGHFPRGVPAGLDADMLTSLSLFYSVGNDYRQRKDGWGLEETPGPSQALLVASEPNRSDHRGWSEVPPQHLIFASRRGALRVGILPLTEEAP